MPLFSAAAEAWLGLKTCLVPTSLSRYRQCVRNLKTESGGRLVCDLDAQDVGAYQRKRLADGVSPRTVNYEVGALRGILKVHNSWGQISDRVNQLKERHDVGKAVSREDEEKLLRAAQQSRSQALLPLLVLSLDTGLRASEVRALRLKDLTLTWERGVIVRGELAVRESKTEAGTGRVIPFTHRACAALTLWLSRFSNANPESHVFPHHKVGMGGNQRVPQMWLVDLAQPMGEWKTAWAEACQRAGVRYRWHDLRHTFVTRLAENPNVSEETIRALAGHVSRQMLHRYSHIRNQAKRAAIQTLEQDSPPAGTGEPPLGPTGHKIGHSYHPGTEVGAANSLKGDGGPSRTRTCDQRIMSPLL